MLTIKNLRFRYHDSDIIRDLNAAFSPGKFYAVVGPNGSGKTTFLDLLSGFLTPRTGTVLLDDQPVSTLTRKQVAQKIALVSQDYTVNFPFPVQDVVMMGRHPFIPRFSPPAPEDYDLADTAIDICGLSHLKSRKITGLSGGEKQRCVFARALCQDTPILLLDEAFSNMDIRHTLMLLSHVKQLCEKENCLVVSVFHDLNLASAWSDDILMLKSGKLAAFGPCDTVLTPQTIKDVFDVDAVVEYSNHVNARQVYYPHE